jgi:hypothetical protein
LYVGAAGVYGLAIAVVKGPLLTIMYGHGYYAGYASLVPVFALVAVGVALAQSLSILVRVTDRPQAVLAAKLAAAVWLGVVGIALVERRGVAGAIASLGGGAVVEAVVLAVALRYAAPRSSAPMGHVLERLPEA